MISETDGLPKPKLQPDEPKDVYIEREETSGDQKKKVGKDLTLSSNEK